MADQLLFAPVRVLTTNAAPGAGYVASFYQSGTTTPVTVYTDSGTATPHGVSVTADATGTFPAVWAAGGAAIKAVIRDADGATVETIDPVPAVSDTSGAAGSISFAPTVELPFTNVQDAIEGAAASAASGFSAYGLGVTGSAAALADLDATGTASGAYRFTGTTTGTFPTGVAAADTGIVTLEREDSGSARMWLFPDNSDRAFVRRMASSTWGTWREEIHANQGAAEGDILYRGSSAWTRLAKGTTGQVLAINSAATAPEWAENVRAGTAAAAASGTSVDFEGIPAWVKRITIIFHSVSLDGTAAMMVRLGTGSTTYVSTGYVGGCGNRGGETANSTGFRVTEGSATGVFRGHCVLTKIDGNKWVQSGVLASGSVAPCFSGGAIDLAAPLTAVRVTNSGSDAFDEAGALINIYWE